MLSMGKNRLTQLPPALFASASLRIFHAQHNTIAALPPLPPETLQRGGLQTLWLSGNPFCRTASSAAIQQALSALPNLREVRMRESERGMPVRSRSLDDIFRSSYKKRKSTDDAGADRKNEHHRRVSFAGSVLGGDQCKNSVLTATAC